MIFREAESSECLVILEGGISAKVGVILAQTCSVVDGEKCTGGNLTLLLAVAPH